MDDIEQSQNQVLTREIFEDEQFYDKFMAFHAYEQAQFYLTLTKSERLRLSSELSPEEMALIFELVENDEDNLEMLLTELNREYAVKMLLEMSKDDVVDIFKKVKPEVARLFLKLMPKDEVSDIMTLFQYADHTAGALMTTEFVSVSATQSAHEALESFKKQAQFAELINYAYVVDVNDTLVGIVSLRDVLSADETTFIPDIMVDRIVSVQVDDSQESVSKMMRDYDLMAIPVISIDDKLLGIVTIDDVIDTIDENVVSDYSALAGVDVESAENKVFKSAMQRVPWLMVLMVFAMLTATLIGKYNDLLSQHSALAMFITLITGTAGNAGTQSLAVTVRKLTIQSKLSTTMSYIIHEFLIGVILGTLTGVLVMLAVGVLQADFTVGFIVGLSMLIAIVVATLVGNIIPVLSVKFGVDPAVASGPFINTLCDFTTVIVYFTVANIFLQYIT